MRKDKITMMSIQNFVQQLSERATATTIDVTTEEVKITFRKFSKNLLVVLSQFMFDKKINEERNDIKIIIYKSILECPKNFVEAKITDANKNSFIKFLISMKPRIKFKNVVTDFHRILNEIIDYVFTHNGLNELIHSDLKVVYYNIINKVAEELKKNGVNLNDEKIARSLSVNVNRAIGETIAIKMLAPNTSSAKKDGFDTYYQHEPNGTGNFPDYRFYFGEKENQDAIKIRKNFNIPKNVESVDIECKLKTRIVGKQTSPEKYKISLKDDELMNKMTSIKVGEEKDISYEELKKMLNADEIVIETNVIYIDPNGNKKTKARVFKGDKIKEEKNFVLKRTSKGQFKITNKSGKKFFGIELGRIAYETGMFN
jgi:hypothetical protein